MTYKELIENIVNTIVIDRTEDEIAFVIRLAYWMGQESKAESLGNAIAVQLHEQIERANKCRYHNMAMEVQGDISYIYDPDYSQCITNEIATAEVVHPELFK